MERLIDLDLLQVRSVLPILLQDRTTKQNIIWATDTYEAYGEGYRAEKPITVALVTGKNGGIIQPRIAKAASDQADRTRKHAEVFTPAWICNTMVNSCDEVWFGRKNVFNTSEEKNWIPAEVPIVFPKKKRWQRYVDSRRLEITCGEAPYLVSRYDASTGEWIPFAHRIGILDRKLRVVNENAADEAEWQKFAFRALESVYGFEYQGDNLLIARVNVLMTFMDAIQERWKREATIPELKRAAKILSWNIWQMDGLKGTTPFGSLQEACPQVSIWDLLGEMNPVPEENKRPECQIYDWRGQGKLKYNDRKTRKGREMKFDFVIGNPPYQSERQGTSKTAQPVYHTFMTEAFKVGKVVELITPARFLFNAGGTPKAWNEKMLSDEHFKVLEYEADGSKLFANTEIKGGVAITYRDSENKCGAIGIYSTDPELNTILSKVKKHSKGNAMLSSFGFVASKFSGKDFYADYPEYAAHERRMSSNVLNFSCFHEQKKQDDVGIYGLIKLKRTMLYISKRYVDMADSNIDKYKIVIPKACGVGAFGETLSNPEILEPMTGFTHTFLGLGGFESVDEASAALNYIKTKFARALLGVLKVTQDLNADKWRLIPLQDFTPASDIDWSASVADIDRQLYRKYGLSEEEITFIETNVKEMR